MVAVHTANRMAHQRTTAAIIRAYQFQRARRIPPPVPPPPLEPTAPPAPRLTVNGLEVERSFTLSVARTGERGRYYELVDDSGRVVWDGEGLGPDPFDALTSMWAWL